MKKTRSKRGRTLALILAALLLASCSKTAIAKISDNSGVGRNPELIDGNTPDNPETTTPPETENIPNTPHTPSVENPYAVGSTAWEVVNGKYTYYFGERDTSGLATVGEMYNMARKNLPDQPDGYDWFPGSLSYDETTGQVNVKWDRYASTLDIVHKYGGIYRGDETQKVCYITFDCGYEYGTTGQILDTLKAKNAPATFFLTGDYVKEEQRQLMQRMLDEGHIVGNHTLNHKAVATLSVDEFMRQLNDLEAKFKGMFPDAPPMHYFRPPSGTCNEWSFMMADKMGYKTVMWSFAYLDYNTNNQPDVAASLANAKKGLHPGCVYLLHAESTTNVAILGDLIDWIRSQGYEILPISAIETQSSN